MAITEQDKRAIDEAVEALYYVSVDAEGNKSIDAFYADYRETNEALLQPAYEMRKVAFDETGKYDPENALIDSLKEEIAEWYDEQRWDVEDEIVRQAGFDPSDDMAAEQIEYLRDTYFFEPPFDHFLSQDIRVNIMLDVGDEANTDFYRIFEQSEAMSGGLSPEDAKESLSEASSLSFLVGQQGHTMDELKQTMEAYREYFYGENADHSASYDSRYDAFIKEHNPFLSSVCQELDNMHNYMNTMTILAKVDMYQFAEMMKPGKEITFPKDAMVGIYSPWNGGGSVLEIALEKELTIPSDKIWDIQVEGASLGYQYSVDDTYGLIQSCWKNVKEIKDAQPEKKPALDSMIHAAQNKAQPSGVRNGPVQENSRG